MERRPMVQRATTYRSREHVQRCAMCGDEIRDDETFSMQEHPTFSGVAMPVHDDCGEQLDTPSAQ